MHLAWICEQTALTVSPQRVFHGPMRLASRTALILLLAFMAGTPVGAHEDEFDAGWSSAERRLGYQHALTMARIQQLVSINRELTGLAAHQSQTCHWMNQLTGPETLARQSRAFSDYAPVRKIIEASMSVQDYLLTLFAVSQTAIVVHAVDHAVETEATASVENIRLYRSNQARIETLLDEPDPC